MNGFRMFGLKTPSTNIEKNLEDVPRWVGENWHDCAKKDSAITGNFEPELLAKSQGYPKESNRRHKKYGVYAQNLTVKIVS